MVQLILEQHWSAIQPSNNLGMCSAGWIVVMHKVCHGASVSFPVVSLTDTNMTRRGLWGLANGLAENTSIEILRYMVKAL